MDVRRGSRYCLLMALLCLATFCTDVDHAEVDWSQSICPEPPPVPNAYRDVSDDFHLTYSCYDGYDDVSGDLQRHCHSNGSYSGTSPTCVLNCGSPLIPEGVYVAPNPVSVFGGDIVRGFCSLPIGFGEMLQITCSEETGQWEPWRLSCYTSVLPRDVELSSEANGSNCRITEAEEQPYWTGTFKTSAQEGVLDIVAVLLVVGDSNKGNMTLQIDVLGEENQPCGEVTPSSHTTLTTLHCRTTQGQQPWGRGVKVTANFLDRTPRQLELCRVSVHGRKHQGQCSLPPALPRLLLATSQSQFPAHHSVFYSCHHRLLPLAGSGLSQCSPFGQWSYPSLACTDEVNLAAGRDVAVLTSEGGWHLKPELVNITDNDVTTSITLGQDDVMYRVNLGQLAEIQTVTVSTSGPLNVTISVASSVTGDSRPCDITERTETLTSAKCLQMYVGDSVDVRRDASPTTVTSERILSEIRVFGRVFDKPVRCLRSPGGADYKGKQSKTTAGNTCLPWVDVISAVPGFEPDFLPDESAEVAGSFCRNPRGEYSTVMCFVRDQDGSVHEELCDVPLCATTCRLRPDGQDYAGQLNTTVDGRACVSWNHPNIRFRRREDFDWLTGGVASEDWRKYNYCRNPGGSQSGLWCYTDANTLDYGFCDVPLCETDEMPFPASSPLVQPAVSTADSLTLPSTQAAHVVITSSSQVTHDDTFFPPEVTHDVTAFPSQVTVLPSQVTHDLTVLPSQVTHDLTVLPSEVTHDVTVLPSQVTHGVRSFPSEDTHDALDFPSQITSTSDTVTFPADDVHYVTIFPSGVTRDAILISSPTPLQLYSESVTVPTSAASEVAGQKNPALTNTLPTVPMNTAPEPVEAESELFGQLTNAPSPVSTIAPPALLAASFTSCVGGVTTAVNCVTFASDVVSVGDVHSVDATVASDVIAGQSALYTSMTPTPPSWLPMTVPPTPVPLQPSQGRENASDQGSYHLATGTLPSARLTRAESLLSTEPAAPVDQSSFALWSRSFPRWSVDGHGSSEAGVGGGGGGGGGGDQVSLHAAATESPPNSVPASFPPHAVTPQSSGAVAAGPQGNSSASRETQIYKMCPCACAYRKGTADVSDSQSLASALQRLRRELHVPRDQLSATIRSKTSAPDHRKSSVATGIVGMSVLGLLALLLVAADVISVVTFLHDVITRRHRVRSV